MTYRTAEVAEPTGAPTTMRLYEDQGLLSPARRDANDYRRYVDGDVARLRFLSTHVGTSYGCPDRE